MQPRTVTLCAAIATACALASCVAADRGRVDLLIRGGRVVDGTGAPARTLDVAVTDGRVVALLEDSSGLSAARVIEARGEVVAPGFIDLHSHADLIVQAPPEVQQALLERKIRQGVTTLVVGNCGLGVAPSSPEAAAILGSVNGWMTPHGVTSPPQSVAEFLQRLDSSGVVLNVGSLIPHGPLRVSAMGLAPGVASAEQLDQMRRALNEGLDAGAFGLSVGLIYPPGMYSSTAELRVLAQEIAARDALFTCHVRGSSETLLEATRELIEIARRSGARVHHSHLEAVGEEFWPRVAEVLALEDRARQTENLAISHDVFLYTRAATMMSAVFPPWALEGGLAALLERLQHPETRERIRREIAQRVPHWPPWQPGGWPHNLVRAVGWDGIIVASVPAGGPEAWVGRSLAELAAESGRDAFDVVADLMVSQAGEVGQQVAEISGRPGDDGVLMSIFDHPAAAVISDAEDYGRGAPHPAHAGGFARALRLARERELMPLEQVVRKMTGYPASLLGLGERGVIREGAVADLVIFSAERVTDRASWAEPRAAAEGVSTVLINGRVVVQDGRYLGGLAGRVLRAGPATKGERS